MTSEYIKFWFWL